MPVNYLLFICYSLVGLRMARSYWPSELYVVGAYGSDGNLESSGAKCEIQTLCPSERSLEWGVAFQLYGTVLGVRFGECLGIL